MFSFFVDMFLFFLTKFRRSEISGYKVSVYLLLFRKLMDHFPKMIKAFYRTSTIHENFHCFIALPTFGIVNHFSFSHVNGYAVVSHYGHNFYLSDDIEHIF